MALFTVHIVGLKVLREYGSFGEDLSVYRPSEGIAHQFLGMMTAFTDTSSPELPYSLNVDHILSRLGLNHENRLKPFTSFWISIGSFQLES